jgi:DNA-binding SARP family transcriptional activator
MSDAAALLPLPPEAEPEVAPALEAPAPHAADRDVTPPPTLRPGQVLFRTLGSAEIHVGGGPVIMPSAERSFSMLVLCAMSPDHVLPRGLLLELVWPDLDQESARHSLRQHLYKLRSLGIALGATRTSVTLSPSCLVPCFALGRTAELFDRDVLRGNEPFGHLFAGWIPSHAPMRHWVEQQRDRFHMDVRRVLVPELQRLRDRADWPEVERWARTVLEFDPYNEEATLSLAEALAMQGGRASARYMLDGYAREVGDLGADLARQVEATQRRIGRAGRVRHEHSATPVLIGRDDELSRLDAITLAAMQGETQIVHLLGPAGIGKTELAYEATRRAVILGFSRCIVRVTRPMGEVPHGTLSRLVRDLLKLPGALGCSPQTMRLLRQLAGEAIDDPDPELQSRHRGIEEHIVDLLAAISAEQPLIVLTDDIGDADDISLAHFEVTWDIARSMRVLWVATSRQTAPSSTPFIERRDSVTRIGLGPLALPHATALVQSIRSVSGREIREPDAAAIALASNGVPRDLVESARAKLTDGMTPTRDERNRGRINKHLEELSPLSRTLLQCVAMLGGRASITLIDECLGETITARLTSVQETTHLGLAIELDGYLTLASAEVTKSALALLSKAERGLLARHLSSALERRCRRSYDSEQAVQALELTLTTAEHEHFLGTILSLATPMISAGDSQLALRYLERAQAIPTSSEVSRSLLKLLRQAAERTSHWQLLLQCSSAFRQAASQDTDAPTMDWELAELEASVRRDVSPSTTSLAGRALTILKTASIPTEARLRAGRIAIGAASDLFESDIAITAHDALRALPCEGNIDKLTSAEPIMQFHTIFGDLGSALELANSAEPHFDGRKTDASVLRFMANAAYVLRVGGQRNRAEDWLQCLWESEALQKDAGKRSFVAWQLSLLALEANDAVGARFWSDRLARAEHDAGIEETTYWRHCHNCRMELFLSGTIKDASHLLERAISEKNRPTRAGVYSLALSIRSEDFIRIPRDQQSDLLQHAVRLLRRVGRYVGQDLLAQSVIDALSDAGRRSEATSAARRYLQHQRRERSLPPASLVAVANMHDS